MQPVELRKDTEDRSAYEARLTRLEAQVSGLMSALTAITNDQHGFREEMRNLVLQMQVDIIASLNRVLRDHEEVENKHFEDLLKTHQAEEQERKAEDRDDRKFRIQNWWSLITSLLTLAAVIVTALQGKGP